MRKEFSRKTKRAAWDRAGGECEMMRDGVRCLAPLDTGRFHYDHIDPSWTSGRNDLENVQVICLPCHQEKTAKDKHDIAKIKRIRDKQIKALRSKRGFRSWRKFNGQIVRADE